MEAPAAGANPDKLEGGTPGASGRARFRWSTREDMSGSDARWKLLISPISLVGPDRANKGDSHANKSFAYEGAEFRSWATRKMPDNFFVICGDRHRQYHSFDPKTGLQEFACGPPSDEHAAGSPGENKEYHRFRRIKGGFLSVTVSSSGIRLLRHDVDGKAVYDWHKP